jgi:hypothetical protein
MSRMGRSRSAILWLAAGGAVVLLLLLGGSRRPVAAAFLRNVADLELAKHFSGDDSSCAEASLLPVGEELESAMRLRPEAASSWRTLLRVKGLVDREWILKGGGMGQDAPTEETRQAMMAASDVLFPMPWSMQGVWSSYRCLNTWGAWTLGLLEAKEGHWEGAVAAYQAGLGLAPGRVPAEIVEEYYLALARQTLSGGALVADQELAVAKYLALAGAGEEAEALFQRLGQDEHLLPAQRCEAERWREWLQRTAGRADEIPPSPVASPVEAGACAPGEGFGPPDGWAPEWPLPAEEAMVDATAGERLVGFDLDRDVLEAGAEVLGTMYWQRPDGWVSVEGFRQPNLWPNSGNSWLRLEGFSTCLVGYTEPPWVSPCASGDVLTETDPGGRNVIGRIHVPTAQGVHTFIMTVGIPTSGGQAQVYGGRWRVEGDFPAARVVRRYVSGEPPLYLEPVLSLHTEDSENLQRLVSVAPPLSADYEFSSWVRPEASEGGGDLLFDDVFSFVLPVE